MSSSEVELVNIGFDPKNFSGTPLVKKTRRKVNGTTKAVSIVGLEPLQSTELNSSLQSLQIGDWQSITTPETPTIFFASSAAAAAGDNLFVEEKDAESENFRVVSVLNNDKV
jgi:hypothetical protein